MPKSENEIPDELKRDAARAASLFTNDGQTLQERTTVAGLLRVLGVDFAAENIVKRGPEPIDVWFRDARFQVTEVLDVGRRRNSEVKQRFARIENAKQLSQLIEPGTINSQPINPADLTRLVSERALAKEQKYGGACRDVDLLVYVNLQRRHIFPRGPFPQTVDTFVNWRSVSVIMERFAIILWASSNAPNFIIEQKGKSLLWDRIESVFPVLDDEPSRQERPQQVPAKYPSAD